MSERFVRLLAALTLLGTIAGAGFLVRLGAYSTIFLLSAIATGAGTFLVLARRSSVTSAPVATGLSPTTRMRINRLVMIGFFVFTAGSLIELRSQDYTKPFAYFVLLGASAGMVGARIALVESIKEVSATLAMVLVVAANSFGSDQLAFPLGIGGGDASVHLQFLVYPIVRTGFIPPIDPCGLFYATFPDHHLLVAMASIFTATDPSRAYFDLGAFGMILPVVVAFLVGRSLFGARIGLLASLMLSGSSYYIYWSSHAAALTFGAPLVALLILSLVMLLKGPRPGIIVVAALFAVALVLTHPYSTVIFALILIGLVIGQVVVRSPPRPWPWGTRIVGVSFLYTLLIYWSNFTCLMTKSFQLTAQYYSLLLGEAQVPSGAAYNRLPLITLLINTAGDSLLQFIVILGFFLVLARGLTPRTAMIIAPTITLFLISVVGLVSPLTYLSPNRIYVFLQFIGFAPLAALGVRNFVMPVSRSSGVRLPLRVGLSALIIAFFVFASSASTIAGFETSPFVGTQAYVKVYDTPSEVASADWLCGNVAGVATIHASRSIYGLERFEVISCVTSRGGYLDRLPTKAVPLSQVTVAINTAPLLPGNLLWFSRYDMSPGFESGLSGPNVFGAGVISRIAPSGDSALAIYDRIYDNGVTQVYSVQG